MVPSQIIELLAHYVDHKNIINFLAASIPEYAENGKNDQIHKKQLFWYAIFAHRWPFFATPNEKHGGFFPHFLTKHSTKTWKEIFGIALSSQTPCRAGHCDFWGDIRSDHFCTRHFILSQNLPDVYQWHEIISELDAGWVSDDSIVGLYDICRGLTPEENLVKVGDFLNVNTLVTGKTKTLLMPHQCYKIMEVAGPWTKQNIQVFIESFSIPWVLLGNPNVGVEIPVDRFERHGKTTIIDWNKIDNADGCNIWNAYHHYTRKTLLQIAQNVKKRNAT